MTSLDDAGSRTSRVRLWLLAAITVVIVGWALHATAAFMVPVVFSLFLALLVAPLDQRVSARVPDKVGWLGHVAAMGAILMAILLFVILIWVAAQQAVERFPETVSASLGDGALLPGFGEEAGGDADASGARSADVVASAGTSAATGSGETDGASSGGFIAKALDRFSVAGDSIAGRLGEWGVGIASSILSTAATTLATAVLIFFLTLLMLVEGASWRRKVVNVLDPSARQGALESVGVIASKLRRYLLARTILGVLTAALYVAWLWFFDVDLLVVWALLALLLNYIPTLGSLISGILPVIYAFVQKDAGTAFAVGAGILVIEQVMGNYVDPRVQGRQVSLSSLVILVTLLVWGWIWGVAGALLAVPITIAAMIISAHVGPLRSFALMLSDADSLEELDRQTHGGA